MPWRQEVQWWCHHVRSGGSFADKLRRLVLAVTIWYLWQERNKRIFRNSAVSAAQLVAAVTRVIQMTVVSWPKAPPFQHQLPILQDSPHREFNRGLS